MKILYLPQSKNINVIEYYYSDIPLEYSNFVHDMNQLYPVDAYLILPINTIPKQLDEIVYNNLVHIPVYYKATIDYKKLSFTLSQFDKAAQRECRRKPTHIFEDIIHLEPENIAQLECFLSMSSQDVYDYILKTRNYPDYDDVITYIHNLIKELRPDFIDISDKIIELYNNMEHINVNYIQHNNDILDMLISFTASPYPLYLRLDNRSIVNLKTFEYLANNMLNIYKVIDKYPDIGVNPDRFGWWLDCVMPYCIYRIIKMRKNRSMFYHIAGYISLWSMFCESGNGCNSWLLLHPVEDIDKLLNDLLTAREYTTILKDLNIISNTPLIEPDPMNIDIDIFDHLEEFKNLTSAVQFVKNNNLYEYYLKSSATFLYPTPRPKCTTGYPNYVFTYPEDLIIPPSGLSLIPWLVDAP